MARIGVRDLHVHELETETDKEATYKDSIKVAGLIEVGVSPQSDTAELFADDGLYESSTALTGYDISINVADLTPEMEGKLLGHTIKNGMVYSSTSPEPRFFGVSFKAERSDGNFEYRQIFKVKFAPSDDNYNTKGETIDFQTAEIVGKAHPLEHNRMFDVRVLGDGTNEAITGTWDTKMNTDIPADVVP